MAEPENDAMPELDEHDDVAHDEGMDDEEWEEDDSEAEEADDQPMS